MSLLMVLSVEPNWNRGYGTSELFVFSTFRIWLHLTHDIPDVDERCEGTNIERIKVHRRGNLQSKREILTISCDQS
jgi:hypothetical protein